MVLGCLSLGAGLLQAAPRAAVEARVVIPDTSLTHDCDPAKLAEGVAELTRRVRELGSEYFSYLDWHPGAAPAAASLVFELAEFPSALGSDYALVLRISLAGGSWTEVDKLPVYAASSMNQPTGNAVKLRARLREVIDASFQSDVFRRRLQEDNLSEIPIASEIQLAEGKNQFIVPLDSNELKVRDGSTLTAKFRVQESTGPAWATFTLRTDESDGDAPWFYNLRGAPQNFQCPPASFTGWNDDIIAIWRKRIPGQDQVKMSGYIKETRPRRTQPAGRLVADHE